MVRRPPMSTRTDTLCPYTPLFRSGGKPRHRGGPVGAVANVLNRDFTPHAPNKVWVTDITYIRTYEGWLFLAAVMDLYRSEEHTSELQSLMRISYAVFCLKKKKRAKHDDIQLNTRLDYTITPA